MDEVRHDAELQPPGRQPGETAGSARAERRAIVAADRSGQAVLAKCPLKTGPNALDGGSDDPQFDQETAVAIGHRQRIDPPLVPGPEPTLEVGAPFVVGSRHRRAGPSLVEWLTAPLHRRDQACALENTPDRRGRRPSRLRCLALKYRQNLARPQIRKTPPNPNHPLDDCSIRGLPTPQRCMRVILKPPRSAALLALAPLIKRVAANPVAPANLRYAPVPALILQKHPNTFFHPTGLSKWHRRALPTMHSETCRGSSRSNLSVIYPVRTAEAPPPQPSPASGRGSFHVR
jgi:hypothetical protein